jgi:hydroxymethylglutaryl-CoA reductase
VRYPVELLATATMAGQEVRDRIVLANDIAMVDPYRAATHNKGVMNGIDAVAIATGNDWRAIESSAHAFAAQGGSYSALTNWSVADNGDLRGEITIPLKAGIVGGTLSANAAAALGLAISGVQSASQLAELMAAVGLAQNFSALKALATSGIQQGHMRLHARSVAAAAGATDAQLEEVVEKLVESGEIKDWKAAEILEDLDVGEKMAGASVASAAGKVILLGEHAVVYGRHALAVPISDAVRVAVTSATGPTRVNIGEWGLQRVIDRDDGDGIGAAVSLIVDRLGAHGQCFQIEISTDLPIGMGLGSSAAIAVAMTRAIALHLGRDIDDEEVNEIAYDCEKLAHGTPSGVDNTLSCYGEPMLFQNAGGLKVEQLSLKEPLPMVVGFSHQSGPTHEQVAGVRARFERDSERYNALFDQIDELGKAGAQALTAGDYPELGRLMNICHGLLNALQVSTPDLEHMVSIARDSGALGAKLTGAGGGGSIIALCPDAEAAVQRALNQAGYQCLQMNTGVTASE